MPRRGYDRIKRCATEGCRETSRVNYEYRRDYADAVAREKGQPPWRCLRHDRPEQVLGIHQTEVVGQSVVEPYGTSGFHTWAGQHTTWAHGPGFMAWAEDFPVGTRLTITARIDLPDGYTPAELPTPQPAEPPAPPPVSRFVTDAVELDL